MSPPPSPAGRWSSEALETAPSGESVPEVEALAALLAEVDLARSDAVWPGDLACIAEQAQRFGSGGPRCGGVIVVSELRVEIPAECELHGGSGRVVIRREGDRPVLDGRADHCCVLSVDHDAMVVLFDVVAEWLG